MLTVIPSPLDLGTTHEEGVAAVKERNDLVELACERTALRQSGSEWVGRCPFHEERTGSFSVNATKQVFYCFGCAAKGDVIDFVCLAEGLEFVAAVEWLGDRCGIVLGAHPSDWPRVPRRTPLRVVRQPESPAWDAWHALGGSYDDAPRIRTARAQDAIGDARSWITSRAREAWRAGDILTLGLLLDALGGDWPDGHRGQWLWITVETLTRDAWWSGDTEALARAVDQLDALDGLVT